MEHRTNSVHNIASPSGLNMNAQDNGNRRFILIEMEN